MAVLSYTDLECMTAGHALTLLGVVPLGAIRHEETRLRVWQEQGCHGEMGYMGRDPELFTHPERLLEQARSIVSFAVRYSSRAHPARPQGFGRVARYAWGRDYHQVLPQRLEALLGDVATNVGSRPAVRIFSDAVPLLERAVAARTGSGFIGKNTMFIRSGVGSHFFLAEVLWDIEVVDVPAERHSTGRCGECTRCLQRCPTNAFVAPYILDARRCISYLSIEKRGDLNVPERRMLGEWLFGCDVCQEACPFNHSAHEADLAEFEEEGGVGPLVELVQVLSLRSSEAFKKRFQGTPLMRAKREGLLRNAACVAANTRAEPLVGILAKAAIEDPAAVVRKTCLWAHAQLSGSRALLEARRTVEEPVVVEEIEALLASH
ncbi:MAG: tRNA epoxyqueuosine(34) reductase QueG [Bdellovibrionota bacterium]|nr:MAG: tRNA epoxyqueuosine(34) reductase QueG [Bdellovibrionota bacterium]